MTLVGGVWADRLPRRTVMVASDLMRFVTQGVIAILLSAGTRTCGSLADAAGPGGSRDGFFNPASTALIPQTVSAGRLQQAKTLLVPHQSARHDFGPAVSGGSSPWREPGLGFTIDAAEFLVQPAPPRRRCTSRRSSGPTCSASGAISRDGWREVRST